MDRHRLRSARRSSPLSRLSLAAGLAGLALFATACGGGSTSSAGTDAVPKQGGSLTMELPGDAGSLSPFHASYSNVADGSRMAALYDTLVWTNPRTGGVQMQLADSLTPTNATAQQWTLKLKPGIQFSDGEPFNAQAVKLNWDTHADPRTKSQQEAAAYGLKTTVVDDLTLSVTLPAPNANFDRLVAHSLTYIAAPNAVARGDLDTNPVGAGPFILKSASDWAKGQSLTLSKNPNYWQKSKGLPYLDQLVFKPNQDVQAQVKDLAANKAQLGVVVDPVAAANAVSDGLETQKLNLNGGSMLSFNTAQGPLADVRVRRAIALALSGQTINDKFYEGKGTPAHGIFSSTSPLANSELAAAENDPKAAAALFNAVTENGTKPLNFTLTTAQAPASVAATQWIVAQLNTYPGVHVTAEILGISAFIQKVNIDQQYDAVWNMTWIDDPEPTLYNWLYGTSANNCCKYVNQNVDKELDIARGSTDPDVRREAYMQVQLQVNQDMPYWVFQEDATTAVYTKKVTGVQVFNDGEYLMDRIALSS